MLCSDFDYELPQELIAQVPLENRSGSRLLCLEKISGNIQHRIFNELPSFLDSKDLIIFNDTRVIPARLFGRKTTGGKIEVLVERIISKNKALCHVKSNKSLKLSNQFILEEKLTAEVIARHNDLFELEFDCDIDLIKLLHQIGHLPLPPYVTRQPTTLDMERYQTIFGYKEGAIAAPTAGLHFDQNLINEMSKLGIKTAFITLHVGAGTFKPVTCTHITNHKMHAEYIEVPKSVCDVIKQTQKNKGRIIAVGTTSVRALETAAQKTGSVKPYCGDTDLFIYPGYEFRIVDALITNFHLPRSTLLMLVSAFGNYQNVMSAYKKAIEAKYRFFSYGDAMFIYRQEH